MRNHTDSISENGMADDTRLFSLARHFIVPLCTRLRLLNRRDKWKRTYLAIFFASCIIWAFRYILCRLPRTFSLYSIWFSRVPLYKWFFTHGVCIQQLMLHTCTRCYLYGVASPKQKSKTNGRCNLMDAKFLSTFFAAISQVANRWLFQLLVI